MAVTIDTFYSEQYLEGARPSIPSNPIGVIEPVLNPPGGGGTVAIEHNNTLQKQGGDGVNFYHLGDEEYKYLEGSSLGIEWDPITITQSIGLPRIDAVFGNDVFLAFSRSERIIRSSDFGLTWDSLSTFTDLSCMAFGDGVFVLVANNFSDPAVLRVSTDGSSWTQLFGFPDGNYNDIYYADGLWVLVGGNGLIVTSSDRVNWIVRTSPTAEPIVSITHGNGVWVAIVDSLTVSSLYSFDGENWNIGNLEVGRYWDKVAYFKGLFIAINGGSTNNIARSFDGINFITSGSGTSAITGLISTPSLLILYGGGSQKIKYSSDGISFTTAASPFGSGTSYSDGAYGKGVVILLGDILTGGGNIARSGVINLLDHSQLNLDDGRNPHGTRYEDLLGTPPETGGSTEVLDYNTAWYTIGASGLTGYVMNQGDRFYVPLTNMIYAKNDVNISKVAFRASGSGSGGSTMRIGIYERTTLNNLSLLADLGTFSTDVLNTIEYTFTNQLLTKGKLYYFVFQRDDTAAATAPTFQSWSNLFVDQIFMVAPASGDMWQTSQALLKTSVTVGALASTDTLPTVSSNVGTPRIQFYLSNI